MPNGGRHSKARRRKPPRTVHVSGLVERHDNCMIIVRPAGVGGVREPWEFPRGPAKVGESPEAAMRRVVGEQLGIEVEIVTGQPPLIEMIDGQGVELRYFFCGVIRGEPHRGPYEELRWVLKGHLREYDFAPNARKVADWIMEG